VTLEGFYGFASPPIYRYLMEIPLGDTMYNCIVNCEIPSVRMGDNYLNFRGHNRAEWQPIQIVFRDVMGDERTRNQFYEKIRNLFSDYNHTQRKINTTISRLEPTGVVVDRWDLRGCFISALHYGNAYLDFSEPELEITLHYDFCNYIIN
jgi:hypothetical protein